MRLKENGNIHTRLNATFDISKSKKTKKTKRRVDAGRLRKCSIPNLLQ